MLWRPVLRYSWGQPCPLGSAIVKETQLQPAETTALVKQSATSLGFDLVRVASADPFDDDAAIAIDRMERGLMDGLPWYTESRVHRGCHPEELLPGAKSIIALGMSYLPEPQAEPETGHRDPQGKVAVYAWGEDYHRVLKRRMKSLVDDVSAKLGSEVRARWYVDDGPMLDRAVAQRAGVGWFGKNTNILTSQFGSWIFLGQIVTDLELMPDPPLKKTCGSCTRCLTACPTNAFVGPYELDNTRCISYLTIEHRGAIPRDLRPLMHDWVFGCDICQDVCPVNLPAKLPTNMKVSHTNEPAFQKTASSTLDLLRLLDMTEEEFRVEFRHSPIKRAKRVGLQRNACVALGNIGDPSAIPALTQALSKGEPLVRSHAAWALGRIGGTQAHHALTSALADQGDTEVSTEIRMALDDMLTPGS